MKSLVEKKLTVDLESMKQLSHQKTHLSYTLLTTAGKVTGILSHHELRPLRGPMLKHRPRILCICKLSQLLLMALIGFV